MTRWQNRMFWITFILVCVSLMQVFLLIRLTEPTMCHMVTFTTQVCEYQR